MKELEHSKKESDNIFYVYLYRDENGIPIYVGKGKGQRAWYHLKRKDKHPFTHKLNKMRRLGYNPQPEMICISMSEELALHLEETVIKTLGRVDLGTGTLLNLTDGGEGIQGWKASEETRKKQSESAKKRIASEETRKKLSESRKGMKYKPKSDETKARLKELRQQIGVSDEARQKMSESAKKRWEKHRQNTSV